MLLRKFKADALNLTKAMLLSSAIAVGGFAQAVYFGSMSKDGQNP